MKVLAGIYSKDSGAILINGNEVKIESVRDTQRLGIVMIHQGAKSDESPDGS